VCPAMAYRLLFASLIQMLEVEAFFLTLILWFAPHGHPRGTREVLRSDAIPLAYELSPEPLFKFAINLPGAPRNRSPGGAREIL